MADKLTRIEELDEVWAASAERPQLVFKHSLICGVSTAAYSHVQMFLEQAAEKLDYRLVEIQRARPVSNAIAERSGVRHESPQVLLIRDGEVVWHASHGGVNKPALEAALSSVS